jgi:hypothetical protein
VLHLWDGVCCLDTLWRLVESFHLVISPIIIISIYPQLGLLEFVL